MLVNENSRFQDMDLTLAGHPYRGRSIGSEQTCHQLPGYDIMFDVGGTALSASTTSTVFITHGHNDHTGGLGSHYIRRTSSNLNSRYYVQPGDVGVTTAYLQAMAAMTCSRELANINIQPIHLGEKVEVGSAGKQYVQAFQATHTIPCYGYAVWSRRRRLNPAFQGASKETILAAKAQGVSINEDYDFPEVCFPGDTNLTLLKNSAGDVVRNAKVLILECTFLDQEVPPRDAHRGGHVHVDNFIDAARNGAFNNEIILLTHFSARYPATYIREIMKNKLRDEAISSRVRLLLP